MMRIPVSIFETPEKARTWQADCPNVYCPHVVEGCIIYGIYGFVSEPFSDEQAARNMRDKRKENAEEGINTRWEYTVERNCHTGLFHVCGNKIDIFKRCFISVD